MKQYISLLLLILLASTFSFAQVQYESKERKEYYQNREFKSFKPLSREIVANYYDDFFKFMEVDDYSPYYDSLNHSSLLYDSLPEALANMNRSSILKYEKKGNIHALIYRSTEFENVYFGEPGIWVAYSDDDGKSWSRYYSGIVQKQPLFVKWYSSYPLINEQGDLQIEACLLRQMSAFSHPVPMQSYQVVKDGLLLTIDLVTLRRDSDGDGLTDIVEAKFRTDPKNADTDGDGILDNLDLNPRYASHRTDRSCIYEAVIDDDIVFRFSDDIEDGIVLPFDETPETHYAVADTPTILIVTDDSSLQNIQPKSRRVIILSKEEYEDNPRYFKNDLNDMVLSPMFKVDGEKDTYLFSYELNTWGAEYCVKKTKEGWKIIIISEWTS